jgi:Bacterial cellulose synthase subunit
MPPFTNANLPVKCEDEPARISGPVVAPLAGHSRTIAAAGLLWLSRSLALVLVVLATVPLGWPSQALAGALLIAGAILLSLRMRSIVFTTALVVVSAFATLRYAVWRVVQTWQGVTSAGHFREWDTVLVFVLLAGELWAIAMLGTGYVASLRSAGASRDDSSLDEPVIDASGHPWRIAPRVIFLLAPLVYLLFGARTFYGAPLAVGAYALPHLVIAHLTNVRLYGGRTAFWNEIGEAVLIPSARLSFLIALIGSRLGLSHDVSRERSHSGVRVLVPFVVFLGVSLAGLAAASQRLVNDRAQRGVVIVNALWTVYNVVVLSIGAAVARQRVRRTRGIGPDRREPLDRRHRRTATATASIVLLAVLAPSLIDADDPTRASSVTAGSADARGAGEGSRLPLTLIEQGRIARVPVVFSSLPTPDELKAAAIVASWFGVAAERHEVRFRVSIGRLPGGNAIVIARHGSPLAASLLLSAPNVAEVRDSSKTGGGQLLVIGGTDSTEILSAAQSFVTRQLTQRGGRAGADVAPTGEAPRAAPRWLSVTEPVPLAVGSAAERMRNDGRGPIQVPFRIPPDLFVAARQAVPLRLHFSYGGATAIPFALLRIRVNGRDVDSIRLAPSSAAITREETVWLPTADLRPYLNVLTLDGDLGPRVHSGVSRFVAIDRRSAIDLRGLPHSIVLPRLDLLVDAGYPFTAVADLSRTAIVLSNAPTPSEYETVLNAVRLFAAQTGSLVSGVTIVDAAHADTVKDKDLLVLGTPAAQPLFERWADSMPLAFTSRGTRINRQATTSSWWSSRWPFQRRDRERLARLVGAGYTFDTVVEQFVSPFRDDRSVVAVVSGDDDGATTSSAFTAARNGTIDGGVAVARDGRFESFRLAVAPYRTGEAGLPDRLLVSTIDSAWLIPVLVLVIALAIGAAHRPRMPHPA